MSNAAYQLFRANAEVAFIEAATPRFPVVATPRALSKYARLSALAALSALVGSVPASAHADTAAPSISAAPCVGTLIVPGMSADSIQTMVDTKPAGTVFCFASGTYVLNHYITMKDSNQFICPERRTCTLDGQGTFRGALAGAYGTSRQVIRGFVVQGFIALPNTWPDAGLQVRDFGLIEDNEIRNNQTGVSVGSNNTIRSNFIHDNLVYGLSGGPGDNILIESNELASNNTSHQDPNNDAGGSKVVGTAMSGTRNLTWRRNHVHDNWGNGIWSDGNVRNATYEENLVENNVGVGINHEISWDAVIRNNTLRNNNTSEQGLSQSCWHGAQITLNNSQNVTISGNTIEAVGTNALCLANTTRNEPKVFPQALANIAVSNNVIKLRGVVSVGVVGDRVPKKVTFSANSYYVDDIAAKDWTYMTPMTFKQWQAAGYDKTGKLFSW
jgi:hypothetical protein